MEKINKKEWFYFIAVIVLYILAIWYVAAYNLSWSALFKAVILQEKGITGLEARVKEIYTPGTDTKKIVEFIEASVAKKE